ncbi:MAG: hypothetical protein JXA82_00985 [Sedimentisphaerales bacterium]|nr:hypothetical protein [Sedimentisphaerales bacterium]
MDKGLAYLTELTWAYRAARVLHAANEFGVFSLLEAQPMTAAQIAEKTGTDTIMLEKLLIACCGMGLLNRQEDRYENSKTADLYLVRDRPFYQGDIIAHAASVWNFWHTLPDTVQNGPRRSEWTPEQHRHFILGMHNITMAGRGDLFLHHIDLSGRKHMFDVGGGPGTYSILACRKYPKLTATVFDLPETIEIAKQIILQEGLQDRIRTQAGSWHTNEFGSENDVVLFSNVLHGPSSNASMKLGKAYYSMVPDALLVVQEFVLDNDKNGPLVPALFNLMLGAYSSGELMEAIRETGFMNPRIIAVDESLGSTWITAIRPV